MWYGIPIISSVENINCGKFQLWEVDDYQLFKNLDQINGVSAFEYSLDIDFKQSMARHMYIQECRQTMFLDESHENGTSIWRNHKNVLVILNETEAQKTTNFAMLL